MQIFNNSDHNKFIKHFKIWNWPSEIDNNFFNKSYKYINYIKWIPWLKMIWIWNSVSMFNSNKESDIDLFIVTSKNRIWFVRILITFIFTILWERKTKNKHAWKFCLSFFCNDDKMNFYSFALDNDIYLYFWVIYLKPILDFDNTYNKFINSQSWADFWKYQNIINSNKKFIKYTWKSIWINFKLFDLIDYLFKKVFLPKTIKHFYDLKKPYWIIINDNILKFHNNDKRKQIIKLFYKK